MNIKDAKIEIAYGSPRTRTASTITGLNALKAAGYFMESYYVQFFFIKKSLEEQREKPSHELKSNIHV